MVDIDVPIGPLWIRRQLFEHSVAIPLLTTSTASQIDFPRLSSELVSASVVPPPDSPAVTYDAWVAAAGLHARLDSSEHAAIIVEALLTNAPDAFLRCNEPSKLSSSELMHYRHLIIPVPELLAFIKLHAAATTSTTFRSFADAVWPDIDLPVTQQQIFHHHQRHAPTSPLPSQPGSVIPISLTPASPRFNSSNPSSSQPQRMSPPQSSGTPRVNVTEPSFRVPSSIPNSSLSMSSENSAQSPVSAQPQSHATGQPQILVQSHHHRSSPYQQSDSPHSHQHMSPQTTQSQLSPILQSSQSQPQLGNITHSPTSSMGPNSGPLDALVRKKSPNHISPIINSQSAIIASAQHALERETRLVICNLKALLLIIASAYGNHLDATMLSETTLNLQSGAVAAESGTLASIVANENDRKPMQKSTFIPGGPTDLPPSTDAVMADDSSNSEGKPISVNDVEITRDMFEHLSFLLTTVSEPSGAFRLMSTIVPSWSDQTSKQPEKILLGRLVDIVTKALMYATDGYQVKGVIDVIEVSNLERKTILRSSMPQANTRGTGVFAHGSDVRVANCNDSHIYFLCSLGRVSFINCRGSTLFVGGCTSVSLINCENVRVHTITRVCRVTNCFDTHLYLCTNTNPQIVGENRGLVFAPYNVAYSPTEIQCHLDAIGVDPNRNVWDKFYLPAFRGLTRADSQKGEPTAIQARKLAPEHLLPFGLPAKNSNAEPTKSDRDTESGQEGWEARMDALFRVPIPLPIAYEEQLKLKWSQIKKVKAEIRAMEKRHGNGRGQGRRGSDGSSKETEGYESEHSEKGKDVTMGDSDTNDKDMAKRSDDGKGGKTARKGVIQSRIQDRFHEWLTQSGRIRQLSDLVRLEHES